MTGWSAISDRTRPSPLQNKVDPNGDIEAVSTREATLMGNRGVLHNSSFQLTRNMVKGKLAWIYCKIEHGEQVPRDVMTPGCYTELFFLDEVSALAAGHRPCHDAECLRESHDEFKRIWYEANAGWYKGPSKYIGPIDAWLHEERTCARPVYHGNPTDLPSGVFVAAGDQFFLLWDRLFLEWSYQGYVSARSRVENTEVRVLTPQSVLRCLDSGLRPQLHASAQRFLQASCARSKTSAAHRSAEAASEPTERHR